ncbi:MAG: FAD-dependent monooxygenase, partial [Proteobacteria bacterium]|nr:FAD-dependent monooxygenase [Pseudomonadota bacterium]
MGKQVVVVGGSVAGLGVGLALSSLGHRVTILERDATPLPPSPIEAFETWDRRGSPQTRHSHAFLARLHNLILDRAPDLYASLREHGAEPLRFTDMARQHFPDSELLPEDEEITLLACRRITFEWVLRRHVLDSGRVKFLDGVDVQGLEAESGSGGPPLVTGVRVRRGDEHTSLSADLVVDASGRRSRLPHWLEAIGGRPLREDSERCGIFYSSRFYALREGAEMPGSAGPLAADLGFL